MKNIIKRILREQFDSNYLERVSRRIEPPYFYNMKEQYGITDENNQLEVMKYIFGNDIRIKIGRYTEIYNSNNKEVYSEDTTSDFWYKKEYDLDGNVIYSENSDGFWSKSEYDKYGNEIYQEHSDGYWRKFEYDINGNKIYFENSNGEWSKWEYDLNGNKIYYEDSTGKIIDNN